MKKLFALLVSVCMVLTALCAFAEEVKEINWSTYQEEAETMDGQMTSIPFAGMKMFVPSVFKDVELSDEEVEKGTFLLLKTEDETAVVKGQVMPLDKETFKATLTQSGIETMWELRVNGISCTNFSMNSDGTVVTCFAFGTDDGRVLMYSFAPANQEPYTQLYRFMAASLQAAE